MEGQYFASAISVAGGWQQASAVPERFTSTSRPIVGQSLLPAEYQGTSAPSIARMGLIEASSGRYSVDCAPDLQGRMPVH